MPFRLFRKDFVMVAASQTKWFPFPFVKDFTQPDFKQLFISFDGF